MPRGRRNLPRMRYEPRKTLESCRVASHGCIAAKTAFVGRGGSFRRVPGVRSRPDRRRCARRTLNSHDAKRHLWRTRIRGDKSSPDALAARPHPLRAALDIPPDWRRVPHGGSHPKERCRAWLSRDKRSPPHAVEVPPASLSHSLRTHSLRRKRGGSARARRRAATASQPPGPSLVCTPQPEVGLAGLHCPVNSLKSRAGAPRLIVEFTQNGMHIRPAHNSRRIGRRSRTSCGSQAVPQLTRRSGWVACGRLSGREKRIWQ